MEVVGWGEGWMGGMGRWSEGWEWSGGIIIHSYGSPPSRSLQGPLGCIHHHCLVNIRDMWVSLPCSGFTLTFLWFNPPPLPVTKVR